MLPAPSVDGPAWWSFGRDAQHSAIGAIATQDLNRISWSTPLDLAPTYTANGALLVHYGSPVVTSHNTVVLPVKTGVAGGFRVEARSGGNGGVIWSAGTDYQLPPHNWVPSYNLALTTGNRLYAPGAGGKLLVKDDADASGGALRTVVFYGAATYNASPAAFDASVFINTPLTIDAQGNVFFGFMVTGGERRRARQRHRPRRCQRQRQLDARRDGRRRCGDRQGRDEQRAGAVGRREDAVRRGQHRARRRPGARRLPARPRQRHARAQGPGAARRSRPGRRRGSATTRPRRRRSAPTATSSSASSRSTFGTHNARGWLLHFDATLATPSVPGGFGWDDTASIVPASMVPSYTGTSSYLLMTKYNDYAGVGSGNGANRLAVIDPHATQVDPISGRTIMKEILTILGPTFEAGSAVAVKEWCINTAAVDPLTKSILVNSEDGYLYRWDVATNRLTQRIQLTSGIGESYTPTAIGADGAVYAVNNAVLFSIAK